ncbi:2-hydroxyacyl-CoA dehydratase subunit D [Geminisphaera colitermitum]|uniref:2-hydroxyacyl-CoA dehydratase subunit D n=1 Tax=Geminisphaera colitermitum TaxID=1148786 RepID=UPI0005B83B9E|nr:2-hydroxyacyl-CoA dehydratase family protein [Geminisphaera colitermitum]
MSIRPDTIASGSEPDIIYPEQFSAFIQAEQKALIDAVGVKKAAYLCNYTPLELLNAAGVRHARLFKGGNSEQAAAGELFTQSVFCDFTKSCIGGFEQGDPFYKAFDKVYNFHTCATMKRASEVIELFTPTRLLNLPKLRDSESSRKFFRDEILEFRDDLAELTGRPITDDDVRAEVVVYNQLRRLLRKFSELRKRANPALTGQAFLDIVRGYYYVEPRKLLPVLEQLYRHYETLAPPPPPPPGQRQIRLMVSGSIMADGDRRILDIVENELGARIVIEDHCAGARPFYHTVPETGDPYQALADGYLDQSPCARQRPLGDALDFSARLAQDYNVDGVLYVFLKFCACYGVSQKSFIDRFHELGLPVLALSSDYSESDRGQLLTRLEAFIDVIREKQLNAATPTPVVNA